MWPTIPPHPIRPWQWSFAPRPLVADSSCSPCVCRQYRGKPRFTIWSEHGISAILLGKIKNLQDAALLDKVDQKIITLLQQNARLSYKELAAQVGLSAPAVTERIARLQERGVIQAYRTDIDYFACGYQLLSELK